MMKKLAGATAALLILGMLAAPAFAQPYPPKKATCGVSDSQLGPGDQVTVSGDNWQAGSVVDLTLRPEGIGLGSSQVRPDGSFSTTVTIPDSVGPGPHTIVCSGVDAEGHTQVLGSNIQVLGAPVAGGIAGTGAPSSLPLWVALAVVLLLGGVATLIVGRRLQGKSTADRS